MLEEREEASFIDGIEALTKENHGLFTLLQPIESGEEDDSFQESSSHLMRIACMRRKKKKTTMSW